MTSEKPFRWFFHLLHLRPLLLHDHLFSPQIRVFLTSPLSSLTQWLNVHLWIFKRSLMGIQACSSSWSAVSMPDSRGFTQFDGQISFQCQLPNLCPSVRCRSPAGFPVSNFRVIWYQTEHDKAPPRARAQFQDPAFILFTTVPPFMWKMPTIRKC